MEMKTFALVCLNVILLIFVIYQVRLSGKYDLHPVVNIPPLSANFRPKIPGPAPSCRPVIPSTAESLYAMYGEGNFADDDEHLLSYIRSMMSQQGPGGRNLSNPSRIDFSQFGGAQFVDQLLNQRRNGFFVECGAFGGEDLSDTLFFERERNWTGILIEANPEYHREILKKNRRALVLRACLHPSPGLVKFRLHGWGSAVTAFHKNVAAVAKTFPETDVQCFSLNSIMVAIGVRHIDFMVLDVEGSELPVLESIDWTRLSVDVFNIEYSRQTPTSTVEKLEKIRDYFKQAGEIKGHRYIEVGKLPVGAMDDSAQDVVFMRVISPPFGYQSVPYSHITPMLTPTLTPTLESDMSSGVTRPDKKRIR